jgi:anti-sigma factor RsiW
MNCREFTEFLLDYLDGQLPSDERATFDEHLAECPHCVRYLQTYEETIRLGQDAFRNEEPALADAPDELIQAILHARRSAA